MQNLALSGKITNKIVAWKLMLGIIKGTHDEQITQSWDQRAAYSSLKQTSEPRFSVELDPNVFNPLSQDQKVRFNQEPLVQAFQGPRNPENYPSGRRPDTAKNGIFQIFSDKADPREHSVCLEHQSSTRLPPRHERNNGRDNLSRTD